MSCLGRGFGPAGLPRQGVTALESSFWVNLTQGPIDATNFLLRCPKYSNISLGLHQPMLLAGPVWYPHLNNGLPGTKQDSPQPVCAALCWRVE